MCVEWCLNPESWTSIGPARIARRGGPRYATCPHCGAPGESWWHRGCASMGVLPLPADLLACPAMAEECRRPRGRPREAVDHGPWAPSASGLPVRSGGREVGRSGGPAGRAVGRQGGRELAVGWSGAPVDGRLRGGPPESQGDWRPRGRRSGRAVGRPGGRRGGRAVGRLGGRPGAPGGRAVGRPSSQGHGSGRAAGRHALRAIGRSGGRAAGRRPGGMPSSDRRLLAACTTGRRLVLATYYPSLNAGRLRLAASDLPTTTSQALTVDDWPTERR